MWIRGKKWQTTWLSVAKLWSSSIQSFLQLIEKVSALIRSFFRTSIDRYRGGKRSTELTLKSHGKMAHSRWVTTANQVVRLYISTSNPPDTLTRWTFWSFNINWGFRSFLVILSGWEVCQTCDRSRLRGNARDGFIRGGKSKRKISSHWMVAIIYKDDDYDIQDIKQCQHSRCFIV